MPHTISEKIHEWSRLYTPPAELEIDINTATAEELEAALDSVDKHYPSKLKRLESQIDYLASRLYSEYEITKYPPHQSDFMIRLRDWLNSADDLDDQKVLFELIPRIFFIGHNEYLSLYRTAFNGPIARWLIDHLGIKITDKDAQTKVINAVSSTWFCSITDSMKISTFYHVNQIEGFDIRPDWTALSELSDPDEICRYIDQQIPRIERIVLLEDFVATGSQMKRVVEFAAKLPRKIPILVCPLVVCLPGENLGKHLALKYKNIEFTSALTLDRSVLLTNKPVLGEEDYITKLRNVVLKTYRKVSGSNPAKLYGEFGFGEVQQEGGLLVVLHTNCPDNTLPLIYHKSDGPWHPIFPRSSRI